MTLHAYAGIGMVQCDVTGGCDSYCGSCPVVADSTKGANTVRDPEPWINTYTGRRVNPLALQLEDICIDDIAHALALTNRFCGHTKFPVSVAQHSVFVSRIVPPEHQLQALLHDASEAYLGDVTRWLKRHAAMAMYRSAEDRAMAVINTKFGCRVEEHPDVTRADEFLVRLECERAVPHWNPGPGALPPTTREERRDYKMNTIPQWSWKTARAVFLAEFRRLTM